MSNEAVELTQSTPTSELSTPLIRFEMSSPDEISTPTSGAGMRGVLVRMRGAGVRMRGFGVSWDPVDGEAMLGNAMGIPALAWPIVITSEDCRIHAQIPEPILLQEPVLEPLVRRIVQYKGG
uniref:Uncharacterized protein n=1 Tax=Tanacetum cinerariifolium TaxID=118510 RepID=A0A699J5K0_TANCI|nr:hypothetical protein [Tanacetum cinerariifolium]